MAEASATAARAGGESIVQTHIGEVLILGAN